MQPHGTGVWKWAHDTLTLLTALGHSCRDCSWAQSQRGAVARARVGEHEGLAVRSQAGHTGLRTALGFWGYNREFEPRLLSPCL